MSDPAGAVLLQLHWQVPDQRRSAFDGWYDEEHLADMVAVPGIHLGRRFRRADLPFASPTIHDDLTLYEVTSLEAFDTDAYQGLVTSPSARTMEVAAELDMVRTVHRQRSPAAGDASLTGSAVLEAWMTCEPAYEDQFHGWYDEEHVPALVAVDGVLHARRFDELERQPPAPDEADLLGFLAVYELADISVTSTPEFLAAGRPTSRREALGDHVRSQVQAYEEIGRLAGPS